MPMLFIHTRDAAFHARDDGADYERPDLAMASGLSTAVALLADEVRGGRTSAAIEISIEQADGTQLLRSVVAISVSALLPGPHGPAPGVD